MPPDKLFGMVFFGVLVLCCLGIPTLVLMMKHQQKMARILRQNGETSQSMEEIATMREEIGMLSNNVARLTAAVQSLQGGERREELTARVGEYR